MRNSIGCRLAVGAAVVALSFAACSAGSTGSPLASALASSAASASAAVPASPSPRPPRTSATPALPGSPQAATSPELPPYRLVLMGDSMLNGVQGAAIPVIAAKLGVSVSVQSWINPDAARYDIGGERAADLTARLRTDEALRADIRAADAIWFDVPLGAFLDACGPPSPTVAGAALKRCLATATAENAKDADAMLGAIVALRPPGKAAIRVLTVWQYFRSTFVEGKSLDVAVSAWQEARAAVKRAATRSGIGVVDSYPVFSGSDGKRDAVAAGDQLSDEVHLTDQGVKRLVDLFVASGLTPPK